MAFHILDLRRLRLGIFDQLVIEEALLRADKRNWCVVNTGHAQTAIVMGIAGQAQKLVNLDAAVRAGVPAIKRFTGGGTVVVDHNTLFVSFICNKADVRGEPLFPRELMAWSAGMYAAPLSELVPALPFALSEHDYTLGDKKVGGNAQSVSRDRWVHHTSWLWDYDPQRMALLQLPAKRPAYRRDRPHGEFLTSVRAHARVDDPHHFLDTVLRHVGEAWRGGTMRTDAADETVVHAGLDDVQAAVSGNERRSSVYVNLDAVLAEQGGGGGAGEGQL